MQKAKLVIVNLKYCDYLRQYDKHVYDNHSKKKNRPFVGALFMVNNSEYFAPLTSPKSKHSHMKNSIDFEKITTKFDNLTSSKTERTIGVINFNNMIPLNSNNYIIIDLDDVNNNINRNYMFLLKLDFLYINENYEKLTQKAKNLYNLSIKNLLPEKLEKRCCDFIILEYYSQKFNNKITLSS